MPEILARDGNDALQIAPAIPAGWSIDGEALVRGNARVRVQMRDGLLRGFELVAARTGRFTIVNPWPGQALVVTRPRGTTTYLGPRFSLEAQAGDVYQVL